MQQYTPDEKNFIRMIVDKAYATDQFFQRLASENFFKKNFRPIMLIDSASQRVILFFSEGKRFEEFHRFMNLVALMEDLEKDKLIIRLPVEQSSYFIGELFDAKEETDENEETRFVSSSTGKYLSRSDLHHLYSRWGGDPENLDPVVFDDPKIFDRLTKAFSGIVYPRETLRDFAKNQFRPVGQRRHLHTMIAAWTAITVSLIFSLLSLNLSLQECSQSSHCNLNNLTVPVIGAGNGN